MYKELGFLSEYDYILKITNGVGGISLDITHDINKDIHQEVNLTEEDVKLLIKIFTDVIKAV